MTPPENSYRRNTLSKVAVYKLKIQKSATFLYINNKLAKKEIRERNPIYNSSQKIKIKYT